MLVAGVVCRSVVPALLPVVSAGGGPAFVRVEGVPVVPAFPAGSGALDVGCPWLVAITVFSLPSMRRQ